jgi:hypothetical protein
LILQDPQTLNTISSEDTDIKSIEDYHNQFELSTDKAKKQDN